MMYKAVLFELADGNPFAPRKKEWLPVALAAAGLASSVIGGVKASKAAKEAEKRQREREAEENAWYRRRFNEDYIDTAAGQNLVRMAKDHAKANARRAAGAAAVAGSTDAATQMAKDAGNKMVGDTIANIAATDQARKDNVDNMHRQAQENFAQQDMNRELQRAQNISNASGQAANAMFTAAAALGQSSPKGSDLKGGGNNSQQWEDAGYHTYKNGTTGEILDLGGTDALIKEQLKGMRPQPNITV